jgi:enoyl-CoA hydratase/carnithine racemase
MKEYQDIIVQKSNGVGEVILNRPEVKNAMSRNTALEMMSAFKELDEDSEVRVIVLSHIGEYFCAGGDLQGYKDKPHIIYREYTHTVGDLWQMVTTLSKPLVASISGHVLGGGVGMIAACDMVIVTEDVNIRCAEINIGMWPMVVMPVLFRSVGRKKGLEMMMLGEKVPAQEAKEIGLVNFVCKKEELKEITSQVTEKLINKSPLALKLGRQVYYNIEDMEYNKAIEYTAEMITLLCCSHDGQEGVKAFFEKRKPEYVGY